VFKRAVLWSLSWAISLQSAPSHPTSLISILISSTHLRLGLPNGPFYSGFPINILHAFLFSPHLCYMPRPSHLSWLIILIILGEEYKLWSSSLCIFLLHPFTSFLFGPNNLLNTPFYLILPYYIRLNLVSGLFPNSVCIYSLSRFFSVTLMRFLSHAHLIVFDLILLIIYQEE
jgi:hypothetical protein